MPDAIPMDAAFTPPECGEERAKWLAERKFGIGGSDAAAILGLSKYRSGWQVWAEKTGLIESTETNEAMHWGTLSEDIIAREWSRRTGKKIRRRTQTVRHKDHAVIAASIDRDVLGESAGLEIKKVSAYCMDDWQRNGPPPDCLFQVHHYLLATGWDRWYVAAWFGHAMLSWVIERDKETLDMLARRELDWWQKHVVYGVEPDPDGSEAYTEAIKRRYANADADAATVEISDDLAARYASAKAGREEWERAEERCRQEIMAALGEATMATCSMGRVTWKQQAGRSKLDTESIEKDHPGLLAKYTTAGTPTRVLRITIKD